MLKEFAGSLLTNGVVDTGISWWTAYGVSVADGETLLIFVDGKLLPVKGPLSLTGASIWCKFHAETITADSGDIDGLENYLANNSFEIELSRREKIVFDGLFTNSDVTEGQFAIKILNQGAPLYAKVKVGSKQGDNLGRDAILMFNNFVGGTVTWGTTADGCEQVVETQQDLEGNLRATKTTVFNSDELITETLVVEGDKTYIKTTAFSVDENGNDVITTTYDIK